MEWVIAIESGDDDTNPSLFEEEDNYFDPLGEFSSHCEPEPSLESESPFPSTSPSSQHTSSHSSASSSASSLPTTTLSDKPDTVSVACRRKDIIPVKEKKRPRKPSPSRLKRRSTDEVLDEFLTKSCRCKSQCFKVFSRDYYTAQRDDVNSLMREELDFVK